MVEDMTRSIGLLQADLYFITSINDFILDVLSACMDCVPPVWLQALQVLKTKFQME